MYPPQKGVTPIKNLKNCMHAEEIRRNHKSKKRRPTFNNNRSF